MIEIVRKALSLLAGGKKFFRHTIINRRHTKNETHISSNLSSKMDATSNDFSTVTPKVTDSTDENVGIAFLLVILAGLATSVGAAVVFFPSLVNIANHRTLAMSLGLSAGVMIFVSFVEIFQKSVDAFEGAGFKEGSAASYTIGCFFAGVAFMEVSEAGDTSHQLHTVVF